MQGRLSPLIDNRIQSFPWQHWEREFSIAEKIGFKLMEWTIDQERLPENPLLNEVGQRKILRQCAMHNIQIHSVTGDCFMQAPFWKANGEQQIRLESDFMNVVEACSLLNISYIVVPLVDGGRLENALQYERLIQFMRDRELHFLSRKVQIIFESDFGPNELSALIDRLNPLVFGINYDVGNSAALGFSPMAEFAAYGHRIQNVHIKDRLRDGGTVPLGLGCANFNDVFTGLARLNYRGNFILQTARAEDADHVTPLMQYYDMTKSWIRRFGLNESAL